MKTIGGLAEEVPGRKVVGEFKAFLLRGNVVDLAVAVAVGTAFTAVVNALVKDFITPLIGIVAPGNGFFGDRSFTVRGSEFLYGDFLNTLVTFLITAAVVFFLVVKPVNHLVAGRKSGTDDESPKTTCPECLSAIPARARRCAFCTAEQTTSPA